MANEQGAPFVLDFPDGQRVEDILKKAESDYSKAEIDEKMSSKADITDIPTVPITVIQKNGTEITPVDGVINITVPTTAAEVSALPDTTRYAASLSLTIDASTFVVTAQLKDQNNDNLGTAQTIDLPLESVVVGGAYDDTTKKVVLTLQNGNTVEFSVADLVAGLQSELSETNKLNPAYIDYDSTHAAVTEAQRDQIETNKNNISSLETKVNTNAAILSQTYNSADCNLSLRLCQDNGVTEFSTYYMTDQSKMHFQIRWTKNQYKYWNDSVDSYKYRINTLGLIATNNAAKRMELTVSTPQVTGETYVKISEDAEEQGRTNGSFVWLKASVNVGDVWYIRPHVEYTDLETGMEYTMYGAVYKVTVGTPCTIECDTLSCTELTAAIQALQAQLGNTSIKIISKEEYDSIEHDANTIYYVRDGDKITLYIGSGRVGTSTSGLMKIKSLNTQYSRQGIATFRNFE